MDVREWLAGAGFEHLVDAFVENEIDWELLPDLNNEDLKELGVAKLGERKRFLAAVAKLNHDDNQSPQGLTADAGTLIPQGSPTPRVEAEYRQLTVMFCDLVDSTELSRKVDAEELRIIIGRFQKACVDAVQPLGGFVARYMGDGVLVYFGYPRANENDPERAVAAGLSVVEAVAKSWCGSVRVGIATGRVIVGDLLGSGPAEERTVIGETPNLAARLQELAQPDTVVVSGITKKLAGGGFQYGDLGRHTVKGFDKKLTVWRVEGFKTSTSRFESNRGAQLNPLVGRHTELMLLIDRWSLASDGEGQAVFVSGEAGIGKSRLIESLLQEVAAKEHSTIRYQCSPHHSTSAFYPVIVQLQRIANLLPDDSPDHKLDKLEIWLRNLGDVEPANLQILAHLLSIPFQHRYGELTLSPQQIKNRTHELLIAQMLEMAEINPMLFLIEDGHWIDPATEELLEFIIGRIQVSRVLLVVTHRPDWRPALPGYNNISSLQLNRLGKVHCASIVRAVAGDFVTDDVVDRIVLRTDGIPLFIEELTKSLVEGGLDIAEADIPATLQASLLARIDRLGVHAKEVIQIGAVIGREVPLDLLTKVVETKEHLLAEGLRQLVASELFFQSGTAANVSYSFKHALVQDSVYDSMLGEVRRQHHLDIAATMVDGFPEIVETAPELIAYHFTEARSYDDAITYWHRAGKRSAGRSADAESVAQLERAIEIFDSVPESEDKLRQSLALHIDLTGPLIAVGGYSSSAMEKNTQRALELAEKTAETHRIFPVLYGRFVFHLHTGHVPRSIELATDFMELAGRAGDDETIVQGHRLLGFALLISGQPERADHHLQQAAQYKAPEHGGSMPFLYGQDIEAAAKVLAAWARLHCGYPQQAIDLFDQALQRAKRLDHATTLGVVLFHGGNLFVSLRMEQRVRDCLRELALLNEKHDLMVWRVAESVIRLGLLSLQGENQQVIEDFDDVLVTYTERLQMNIHTPFLLAQAAQASLGLQFPDDSIAMTVRALNVSKQTGGHLEDSEVMRIQAQALCVSEGFSENVDRKFRSALEKARLMKMKWYELRIASEYAKYLSSSGNKKEAGTLLKPLFESFTEGHQMPDMVDALATLEDC